jgi:hypothetical protein
VGLFGQPLALFKVLEDNMAVVNDQRLERIERYYVRHYQCSPAAYICHVYYHMGSHTNMGNRYSTGV